jgi:Lipase (class 3)
MIQPLRHTELLSGTLQNLYFPPNKYTYFRSSKSLFVSGSSTVRGAWAADASMLAYARYGQNRMTDAELDTNFERGGLTYKKIGNWDAPGTQAFFASCDQFAILAFRGTEADDPEDCLYDGDLALVHEPDYRPVADNHLPGLGHLAYVEHLFSPPCLVHRGFQLALRSVWEQVHEIVTSYRKGHPGVEICFTGHSLGGALAVLAFSRFADPDLSLFTFGCPRTGDGPFRDRVLSTPAGVSTVT